VCKRVRKSVKRKGIGRKTSEGWNVEEKEVESSKLKARRRRKESGEGYFGGGGVEHSQLMITLIILFVNYNISTSIWRMDTFFRTILQGKENKGVELTGGGSKVQEPRNAGAEGSSEGRVNGAGGCEAKNCPPLQETKPQAQGIGRPAKKG